METIKPTPAELKFCMKDPECIRNVCIVAHVDHGKTTVADLLLATNRIVSKKMAGTLRFLDDRPDEQERGITMKSSAVSLLNIVYDEDRNEPRKILLHLIDTPGHIDFASEVGAAVRVCDGSIIIVDAVEGVCVQTRESICKAYEEQTKMILVINKLDRLIMELDQDVDLMFQTIIKVIEDCNVIIAEVYQYGFTNVKVDIENTGLLFSPETGNVIFASAIDGWGFTTKQISRMVIGMVKNETIDSLNKKMWNFDNWVDSKGEIKTGAVLKKKPNIFVQYCLKTIVHIYQTLAVKMEKHKVPAILKKLKIIEPTREMLVSNDPKNQIRAIFSAWKPLAHTLLLQCLYNIPSPKNIGKTKIEYLLNTNHYIEDAYLNKCVKKMTTSLKNVSSQSSTICYVSKMFCVNKKNLSQNAPKKSMPKPRQGGSTTSNMEALSIQDSPPKEESKVCKELTPEEKIKEISDEIAVIGLTRVYTGSLKVGQEMYAMTSGYLPNADQIAKNPQDFILSNKYVHKIKIKQLYMLFGRDLAVVDCVPAGNFCGIGGIESAVLRTATLSTKLEIVPLIEHPSFYPVVRYAIEPINTRDLPILRNGLKLLMQSDSCVQVMMQETGELVILTAGDVHLEKCIQDLKTKFAKVDFQVSSPMVYLRETVNDTLMTSEVELMTGYMSLSLCIVALPKEIANLVKNHRELLIIVEEHQHKSLIDLIKYFKEEDQNKIKFKEFKSEVTNRSVAHLRNQLNSTFNQCGSIWSGLDKKIWSVGKLQDCPNLLINGTKDYTQNIFLKTNIKDKRTLFGQCLVNPFHAFSKAGPICEEPLMNCAFIVTKFELLTDIHPEEITPQIVSAEESAVMKVMKNCFEKQKQRLMEPIYTTSIQVNTSILGKVYSVISRRHGKVLDAVGMDEKEKAFLVQAQIPVIESEGFAGEIRKTTSGQANPSLRFSHYEIIDGDPYYAPVEEPDDTDEEFEAKMESGIRAIRLRREVRRRKGLKVEDEVVVHAEKQRTLKK